MNELFQLFQFKKPIIFKEDLSLKNHDFNIVAYQKEIQIRYNPQGFDADDPEMLASIKLGEIDPLLITFFFQKGISDKEEMYAKMFAGLCEPLRNAWVYKMMRRYAPKTYEKELQGLLTLWDILSKTNSTDNNDSSTTTLSIYTIFAENPENKVRIKLVTDAKYKTHWEHYVSLLVKYARLEPNIDYYMLLVNHSHGINFTATLREEDGYRYFFIKERKQ